MNLSKPLEPFTEQLSLQERTYRALRKALLDGKYATAERIFENEVATMLGVSRVPVREAVRRLQQDGLIEVRPRSGIYVTSLSPEQVDDIYRIRAALEGAAAGLAAERITEAELRELGTLLAQQDEEAKREKSPRSKATRRQARVVARADEFHRAVHRSARSPRLYELLELIYAQVMQFRGITLRMPGRVEAASHGHHALYEALVRRDSAEAERLMREHVSSARLSLLSHLVAMATADAASQSDEAQVGAEIVKGTPLTTEHSR
jgi:DNA-binding GntR family transcriptional regulator